MNAFESVSYSELAKRFVELNAVLNLDNPKNIDVDQARNMHKAFVLSYMNLTDNLTPMQEINAPQLITMADALLFGFESSLL